MPAAGYFTAMEFHLPEEHAILHESDRVPLHLHRCRLSGAQCRYIRFDDGEVLTQVLLGNDFSIWIHHFFIKASITLYPFTRDNLLMLHFLLKGDALLVLQGIGKLKLEESTYQLFYVPANVHHEATFHAGEYICFHVNFHPNHIESIARQYPVFGSGLSKAEKGIHNGESYSPAYLSHETKSIIQEILRHDLENSEKELFLQSRIRDLLRMYVHEVKAKSDRLSITGKQQRLIGEIEAYIEANLDKELTVRSVAGHFNTSRSWLQQICKNQFNKGIHQLVMQKRMEAAASLLLTTQKSVSSIALMVSNLSFSAFTAGFHQYYGITPSEYRRINGQKR